VSKFALKKVAPGCRIGRDQSATGTSSPSSSSYASL
jgi:hypothetical protein